MSVAENLIRNSHPTLGLPLAGHPLISDWISFAVPGQVTAYTGKVEIGQGISTALAMIVAEELDAPARWHEAADRVQQRGLPGTVRADQTHDLPGHRPEFDVVDRDESPERDGEALREQHAPVVVGLRRDVGDR